MHSLFSSLLPFDCLQLTDDADLSRRLDTRSDIPHAKHGNRIWEIIHGCYNDESEDTLKSIALSLREQRRR